MTEINLSDKELKELIEYHRQCKEKKNAYRINVVILLAKGYTYQQIEDALLVDERTARRYKSIYLEQGVDGLFVDSYKGSSGYLKEEEIIKIKNHLKENVFNRAKDIVEFIKKEFNVTYTPEGLVPLLHRMGFEYKKAKHIPGKANTEEQKRFVKRYKKIRKNMGENDVVVFTDAVHPTFNSITGYGWILKGTEKYIKSNTGREKININGAINPVTHDIIAKDFESINYEATIELLRRIKKTYSAAENIYVFMDRAKYNYSLKVRSFAEDNRMTLEYLPAYSPNLNLIERLWHFMKKETMYNKYYESYSNFRKAIMGFFSNKSKKFKKELKSLITEEFHLFNTA
jgi:transposase